MLAIKRSYLLKGLMSLALIFLLLQFVGFKMFIDNRDQRFDTSPWGMVKRLMEASHGVKLPVFVVEPSLLRALRGDESALELWDLGKHSIITFGVIEPSVDNLHRLLTTLTQFLYLGLNSPDPRDLSKATQTYRMLPAHYLMWRPNSAAPIIHLVIFYHRGDYLWFGRARSTKSVRPPMNTSLLSIGHHEGYLQKFSMKTAKVRDVQLSYPEDTLSFVWALQHSKFVECDFARAQHFLIKYGKQTVGDDPKFRRTARQLLSVVSRVLDGMEVPFWLSSGTCLGWYRQCDIIPYSKDVDIGIRIRDHREELVMALENAGLQLVHLFGKVSDSLELSFMYGDVKLDIFFFYEEKDHIWNGGTQAKTGKKFKYTFPKFSLSWTEFLGLRVRVPDPPLPYIEANYGKKWEIPVREWDWKKSPPNVAENGEWPPGEREEVIQLFEWEEKEDNDQLKKELKERMNVKEVGKQGKKDSLR
ncbi:hypothetical protein ACOMHN_003155 [Nucella lapillus]